jgi:hypothetical protein
LGARRRCGRIVQEPSRGSVRISWPHSAASRDLSAASRVAAGAANQ